MARTRRVKSMAEGKAQKIGEDNFRHLKYLRLIRERLVLLRKLLDQRKSRIQTPQPRPAITPRRSPAKESCRADKAEKWYNARHEEERKKPREQ